MKRSLIFLTAVFGTVSCVLAADFHTGQAARLVIGQTTFSDGATGTSETQLGAPSGVAYVNNQLFIADSNRLGGTPVNNRVLIYSNVSGQLPAATDTLTPATGIHDTCAACVGVANVVLGQPSFATSDPGLTASGMRTPASVASNGKVLVVADSDNNRILIWNTIPSANGTPADVVIGQPDFTHAQTASPPTAKSLRGPQGVWMQDGKLYIADTQDNRVLVYNSIPTANNAAADLVLGQPTFTTFVSPDITKTNVDPTASNMSSPVAIGSDGHHLLVTDLGHNRILIWNSIPTQNNQAADQVLGQPDFVNQVPNYASALCPSNGTDPATNKPAYPARCGATLSFPRAAITDGTRLFVADGGNDRVLVYSQFPTANGATADVVLGQTDAFVNNSSSNTDAFATPVALAWDGSTNLYVGDTFNRRVVVYSPGEDEIALSGVRNSASLEIYAIGRVVLAGTPAKDNVVTLTIGTTPYAYTVKDKDTLADIVAGLTALVNAGNNPDVLAIPNTVADAVVLTARKGGDAGVGITYDVTFSSGTQLTRTTAGPALTINLASATQLGPGSLITIEGKNLSDQTAAADLSGAQGNYLPMGMGGVEVYIDGNRAPLLYVSPTQINTQIPLEVQDRTSVSIYVKTVRNDGSITASTPVGVQIVSANPGIFAFPGSDPRPGLVFHADSNATGLISVDGVIKAGDVATVTVGGNTYTYTVLATDTLESVRDALLKLMANDPNVVAAAANEFSRILLEARPGADSVSYGVSVNSGGVLILTAFSSALCCASTNGGTLVTPDNPARPGETVFVYATGLGVTAPLVGDLTGFLFPSYPYPPATPVDSVLAGGSAANIISASLVPGLVGVWKVSFQLSASLPTDPQTQLSIAQQLYVSNVVTFPVATP